MTPTFQGEVQFRRYSDTSTQGQQIVFAVQDREALESFVGMEGKRFMAVLVQIGDDEQPIPAGADHVKTTTYKIEKPRERLGDLCYRAVQWCNDSEFQKWLAIEHGARVRNSDEAALFIKDFCRVESRKDLDSDPKAKQIFQQYFVGPWQKYQLARRAE